MTGSQKTATSGTSLGLLAVSALFFFSGGSGSSQSGPSARRDVPVVQVAAHAAEAAEDAATPVPAIRRPLYSLLNAGDTDDDAALKAAFTDAHIRRLDFLIVTLPDPIDSSLGYTFDGALNTLQAAVRTQGFLIDRYYLPWHQHSGEADQTGHATYHHTPGVLQFRRTAKDKTGDGTDVLLVYLIGETPVSGIHQPAFDRAVAEIDALGSLHTSSVAPQSDGESKDDPVRTVHVVGSTFSGSVDSLARSVARAADRELEFHIISGTASNVKTSRIKAIGGDKLKSFASMRIPARLTFLAAVNYLKDIRSSDSPLRIAWLHEANTSFGSWLTEFSDERPTDKQGFSLELTAFPFPLHVSRIRSLIGAMPNEQRQLFDLPADNEQLQLSFEHSAEAKDAIPQLSPGMTNPTTELVLSRILATIKEHEFHYIGITATDSQDRIFLCERMREYCPDVQIILDFSNRIFTHPRYRRFMKGTLVTSTYPMYVANQKWSYPYLAAARQPAENGTPQITGHRQVALSSEYLSGIFNATVLTLHHARPERYENKELPLIDYGEPFLDSLYRQNSDERQRCYRPPLWISVVGNGTLQPLRYWPVEEMLKFENELLPKLKPSGTDQVAGVLPSVKLTAPDRRVVLELSYTMAGKACLIWLLGVTGVITWIVGRTRYDPTVLRPDPQRRPDAGEKQTVRGLLWGLLERRIDPRLRRSQTTWLIVMILPCWLLLTYCTVASLVPLLVQSVQAGNDNAVRIFLLAGIGAAAGVPALIVNRYRHKQPERKPGTSANIGLAGVVVAIVIVACITMLTVDDSRYVAWFVSALQLVIGTWLAAQLCGLVYDRMDDNHAVRSRGGDDADDDTTDPRVRTPYIDEPGSLHVWTMIAGGFLNLLAVSFMAGLLDLPISTDTPEELTGQHILWFERTFRVTSGVSWLVPAALAIASCLFWVMSRLTRLFTLDRERTMPPWHTQAKGRTKDKGLCESLRGLSQTHSAIEAFMVDPCQALRTAAGATVVGVFLLTILILTIIARNAVACFEGSGHTLVLWGAFAFLITLWVYWIWELGLMIWLLRKLLSQIAWLPMTAAFLRVPERVRTVLGRFMVVSTPRPSHLRIRVQYLKDLVEQVREHRSELRTGDWPCFKHARFKDIDHEFADDLTRLRTLEEQGSVSQPTMSTTHSQLNLATSQLWVALLREWSTRGVLDNYPCSVETEFHETGAEGGFEGWKHRAEELVAIQIRAYITAYAAQLRHLLIAAMCSSLLFLLAVLSYPLQPQSLLTSVAMIMVVIVSMIATWAITQFDRNDFLRRIQGSSNSGQFDMQLWLRTATWLAPAIMVALSAVFPSGWGWIYTVLEPVLTATN